MARRPRRMARWTPAAACAVLRNAVLFRALADAELEEIFAASEIRRLGANERLWSRGERAPALGVVLRGRVKLVRPGVRDVLLAVAAPPDILGEIAFTTGGSYLHDVISMRFADVLLVPARAVRSMLQRNPHLALDLALDLAQEVVRLTRVAEDLSAGNVDARLARVLLRLADRTGEPFPGGTLIPVKLRRVDLAAMAATTLETASRRISEWQRRGYLTAQPAGYLLRDPEALRALAGD